MTQTTAKPVSRRRFLKTAGATALAAGAGPGVIIPGRAQPKTLKILQMKSFVPGFGQWFSDRAQAWGRQNDTRVTVDYIGFTSVPERAAAEITAQQGHDLIVFSTTSVAFEDHLIDHREIYEECERRYGKPHVLARKASYNPKTNRFNGIASRFVAPLSIYRKDLWDAVGVVPDTWENIWRGGRWIKLLHERPVGISLAPEFNSNITLRAILYSFGASVQDADGRPALKSKQTLEAIKFVKALYNETMTENVLGWDPTSNNRVILAGEASLTVDAPSVTRTAEAKGMAISDKLWLASVPQGPVQRLSPSFGLRVYAIWRFANNIDGAKQFLSDYIGYGRDMFVISKFEDIPCFLGTIPDLAQLVASDPSVTPPDKYQFLANAKDWSTNVGYPGYTNAPISEVFYTGLIPTAFASAATGKMTPDEALTQADQEVRNIFAKWRALGKV